ncbi:MAG TPA: hypothetical protein VK142_03715 [Bacillota bacterium]|nr:hypothetical protein [Bacillota bacterium]
MPYIFVAASAISVLVTVFIIKWSMDKIKADPEVALEKVQQYMFVGVGLAETIPIILIIVGFQMIESVNEASELFVPMGIVVLLAGFAVFFIFLQLKVGVPAKIKPQVHTMGFIGIGLSLSIPIVSIVALFTMMP